MLGWREELGGRRTESRSYEDDEDGRYSYAHAAVVFIVSAACYGLFFGQCCLCALLAEDETCNLHGGGVHVDGVKI